MCDERKSQDPRPAAPMAIEVDAEALADLETQVVALVAEWLAAQGFAPADQQSEAAPDGRAPAEQEAAERPAQSCLAAEEADPGLVAVHVLKPLHEQGADYALGASFLATCERAERLEALGLVTRDAGQAPPPPPPVDPEPFRAPVPRGMVWGAR